ncbi:MAG: NYN domain-containing protein [Calditrichaeota bacterium]|nr:MAG: NYN domain-containing protein [Calditrichota bacterium]
MGGHGLHTGVYVDVANIAMNGGFGMRFDVLRQFAAHDGAEVVRLNAYVVFDQERANRDSQYNLGTNNFYSTLRDYGYKVITKYVKRYKDDEGNVFSKANTDLEMAVDVLLQSEKLDKIILCTGDGDFIQVVRALQNKGCSVELVAFENISRDLRKEVDVFVSGYIVPNLLPVKNSPKPWGEPGSRVRGYCYEFKPDRNYGFLRYLNSLEGNLWITDTRHPRSPYQSVFFHEANLESALDTSRLPSRDIIFEFELALSKKEELEARHIQVVCTL